MALKCLLLLCIVGTVFGNNVVPENQRKGYVTRLFQEDGLKFRACTESNGSSGKPNTEQECFNKFPRVKAVAPTKFTDLILRRPEVACMEEKLPLKEDGIRVNGSSYLEDYWTEDQLCHYLDEVELPLVCATMKQCPETEQLQLAEIRIIRAYTIQQFAHGGMNVKFNCSKTGDIQINPSLYNWSTEYSPNLKFLLTPIDCKKYE